MDKYLLRPVQTLESRSRSPSPIRVAQPVWLGILGARNDMNKSDICEKILHPIIDTVGKLPEKIIIPTEGNSNIFIGDWAERQKIPCTQIYADWRKDGKKARVLRDNRILQEATHLVCLNGPKSDYYEKLGTRWLKKKSGVFVLEFPTQELVQLQTE